MIFDNNLMILSYLLKLLLPRCHKDSLWSRLLLKSPEAAATQVSLSALHKLFGMVKVTRLPGLEEILSAGEDDATMRRDTFERVAAQCTDKLGSKRTKVGLTGKLGQLSARSIVKT